MKYDASLIEGEVNFYFITRSEEVLYVPKPKQSGVEEDDQECGEKGSVVDDSYGLSFLIEHIVHDLPLLGEAVFGLVGDHVVLPEELKQPRFDLVELFLIARHIESSRDFLLVEYTGDY